MKIIERLDPPVPIEQTIVGYTLELTPEEMHDLRVIASIPTDVMRAALRQSTAAWLPWGWGSQTHNVYDLLKDLQ